MEPGIQGAWDRPSPGPQELSLVLLDRQEPQSTQGSALPFPRRPPCPSHVEEKLFNDMTADPQARSRTETASPLVPSHWLIHPSLCPRCAGSWRSFPSPGRHVVNCSSPNLGWVMPSYPPPSFLSGPILVPAMSSCHCPSYTSYVTSLNKRLI